MSSRLPPGEENELKSDWLEHPVTRTYLREFETAIVNSLTALLGACASSTDPEVRGQYERHMELKRLREGMKR